MHIRGQVGGTDNMSDGVAIVTGAGHGIGLGTAQRLAARGLAVAAVDIDADVLHAAPLPAGVMRMVHDIATDPIGWVLEVEKQFGVPTVLVNNAAAMSGHSFLELSIDELRRSVDVTLFGTWALTRAVVQRMIAADQAGAIVFNLSLHTTRVRMSPDYSAAKAALLMLTQELASELGPYGIRVNAVSPGAVDTWSERVPEPDAHVSRSEALVPLGRLGTADDVAKAIDFLADSEASGYITGADIKVDGGLSQFNWLHHLYGTASAERQRTSTSDDATPEIDTTRS
ncbi:MAG: SDR family NAD(P)-dependent oxidoreductase [Acidimicrobiales bacterium]